MVKDGLAASPDPEVTPKAKRRSFSAAYKKKILAEVDAAAGPAASVKLLRREGHLFLDADEVAARNAMPPSTVPFLRSADRNRNAIR